MDYRRDLFPPLLALTFSLGLHSALFGIRPIWWAEPPPAPVDTVVVEFLDDVAPTAPVPSALPTPDTPPPTPAAEEPPVAAKPVPAQPDPPLPDPLEAPSPEPDPLPATAAPEPAPEPLPAPSPPAEPIPSAPDAALEVDPQATPSISDLLPNASDLQRFAGRSDLPDPTAAGVREATLSLGNEDLRYRGYLETVHAEIDRSERWKEAVLMGGGGGVVVVRMTITSLGQLVSASVTRGSGSHLLDTAALDAVQRAQIPPFPSHWKIEKLHLHAQFNYQLVTY